MLSVYENALERETLSEIIPDKCASLTEKNLCSGNIRQDTKNFSYYPISYPILAKYFDTQEEALWTAEEIRYEDDRKDWEQLDIQTSSFVKFILFFFAQVDGIINENLIENFKRETSFIKEATHFYTLQAYVELVHNKAYSMMIETFISDPIEKSKAFDAILHYPIIADISKWVAGWMDTSIPLLQRVIAFVCVEGIFFCSSFASIYWLKKKNILAGLCLANHWIARDEGLHTDFGIELFHVISKMKLVEFPEVSTNVAHSIIRSACEVSEKFTRTALKENLPGLTSENLISYVRCTADHISDRLGYGKIYNVPNQCTWMMIISLPNKTNFFESAVTEYNKKIDYFEIITTKNCDECDF
ncbi:MAG TPA: ribonucleotide-diphosphate reductase subunit beta [Nitrosarchaeum sp.]|nr:ribonucleotide-diphosphate reductase subunit beta [Nitrosarchaeum sp.]